MTRKERRAQMFGNGQAKVDPKSIPTPKPVVLYDDETILEDDYPVFWDYLYIADGRVIRSDIRGVVSRLKADLGAKEIRRCNIAARQRAAKQRSEEANP